MHYLKITRVAMKVNSRRHWLCKNFFEFDIVTAPTMVGKDRNKAKIMRGLKSRFFSYFLLEPLLSIGFRQPMFESNSRLFPSPVCYVIPWSSQNNIKVHSINANVGVVFYAKINMFLYTKTKVACFGEISSAQFIFFYF